MVVSVSALVLADVVASGAGYVSFVADLAEWVVGETVVSLVVELWADDSCLVVVSAVVLADVVAPAPVVSFVVDAAD